MTELLTTLTVLLPTALTFAVAAHNPRDAAGNRVLRSCRTFAGDFRSFFHLGTY